MKRLPILFFYLLSLTAFSQQGKVSLSFCPLTLTGEISFPTIQGGVELGLSKKLAWYNELGVKYRSSNFEGADTSHVKSSGLKIKTEFRYYFTRKSDFDYSKVSKNPEGYLGLV